MSSDRHAVFAATADGSRYRMSMEMSYDDALNFFGRMDTKLKEYNTVGKPCRIAGSQVEYFHVRSMSDEDWASSPEHNSAGNIQWGYEKQDYMPGGSQWSFSKAIRLSEVQQDALAYAAEHGHIPGNTHHKCYYKLQEMGLIRSATSYAQLTPLGEAVAERAYTFVHGMSVADAKAERIAEAARRENARKVLVEDTKFRLEGIIMQLGDVQLGGKSAREYLARDGDYYTPLYEAKRGQTGGYWNVTLSDLEAIVEALTTE